MNRPGATWNYDLARFVGEWPPELSAEFRSYWHKLISAGPRVGETDTSDPAAYWLALPGWLASRYAGVLPGAHRTSAGLLPDLLWGQYALFIAVRIQDDLFDCQTGSGSLIFAADRFLIESARCYCEICGNAPGFWKVYGESLDATTQAILETDLLQKSGNCPADLLLRKYAQVGSIFKVGSAALCLLAGRFDEFGHVSRFCDEMAMVSQIFDDLEDLLEDLRRGRANYAARSIGATAAQPLSPGSVEEVLDIWLADDALQMGLLREIQKHIALAEEAVAPLELPGAGAYCLREKRAAGALEQVLRPGSCAGVRRELFRPGGIASLIGSLTARGWTS